MSVEQTIMESPWDLAMVMPVYNEADCITQVVDSWVRTLSDLGIRFRLIVLNDGSRDATQTRLEGFASDPRIVVINKPNEGHGPTILRGYRMAVEMAVWTFQCDSDDEIRAEHFARFWERRDHYEAIFGIRSGRTQNTERKFISAASRGVIRFLFGRGVDDVNVPYRLMRSCRLREILDQIPCNTFAPNLIIAGAFARSRLPIANLPVPHEGRRTGTVSIMKWRLWKAVLRAFVQTLRCRPRLECRHAPETQGTTNEHR